MAEDIFVSNDIEIDADFGAISVIEKQVIVEEAVRTGITTSLYNTDLAEESIEIARVPDTFTWDFTQSLVDTTGGLEAVLTSGRGVSLPIRDETGLHFTAAQQYCTFPTISLYGKTVEINVAQFQFAGSTSSHSRFLMWKDTASGPLIFRNRWGWSSYGFTSSTGSSSDWETGGWGSLYTESQIDCFDGKTIKLVFGADGHTTSLYVDDALIKTITDHYVRDALRIGGSGSDSQGSGDQAYNVTITGFKIYPTR